jgi:hypothetical protein
MAEEPSQPRYPRRPGFTGAPTEESKVSNNQLIAEMRIADRNPRNLVERKAPELFSFKTEGDLLEGTLLRVDTVVIEDKGTHQKKRVPQYTMRKENGDVVKFLGTYDLDCKIYPSDVGSFLEIVYVGENREVRRGNNFMRVFKVNIDNAGAPARAADSAEITDADITF